MDVLRNLIGLFPNKLRDHALGITTAEELPRITTTLYDVIAALQSVVAPEDDALVVTIVAAWLRSGRLRVPRAVPLTA